MAGVLRSNHAVRRSSFSALIQLLSLIAATTHVAMSGPAQAYSIQTDRTVDAASAQRITDLVRAWYFARLFHPDLASRQTDWERALIAAVEPALAATDDAAFVKVADEMLQTAGSARALPPAVPAPASAPKKRADPFRVVDGALVANCIAIAETGGDIAPGADQKRAMNESGLIVDCRGFASEDQPAIRYPQADRVPAWLRSFLPNLTNGPVPGGALRLRYHDGYPPEMGTTSGGYVNGTVDQQLQPLLGGSATHPPRIIFLFDENTPSPGRMAGGMQAAGLARVVNAGPFLPSDPIVIPMPKMRIAIPQATYVYPNGKVGFRADACATDEDALKLAIRLLDPNNKGAACPVTPAGSGTAAGRAVVLGDGAPAVGERVLALAKLWGAIEYFYPYKDLLDQPWYLQLDRFVGSFLTADTLPAYEEAVQRLAHHIHDTHVFVGGLRASEMAQRQFAPPLYLRPVGKGLAVAGLHDPAVTGLVAIGDEILAVDGQPVTEIAGQLREFVSISTPQSFAGVMARLVASGGRDSEARLTLRRGAGAPFEVSLKRSLPREQAAQRPASASAVWRRLEPDLGYIDLSRLDVTDVDKAMDELQDTKAIIFDLRGYPRGTAWTLAPRLAPDNSRRIAALFRRPTYRGPSFMQSTHTTFEQTIPFGNKRRYQGRVVVMIDDRAISQSEHTALFIKAAVPDAFFVGTPTTGTNGDVTFVTLPGGLFVTFTGQSVRFPDGRELERVGIKPDMLVAPTLEGLRSGKDEVLSAAVEAARHLK